MSNNNPLIIYQKYIDLIYYSYNIVTKFPKPEKFTLVHEIKQVLSNGLRALLFAQKEFNKKEKLKHLNELDTNLVLLKINIRLSYKYKYISLQNYNTWSELITNVCNLLGGWIKSCLSK